MPDMNALKREHDRQKDHAHDEGKGDDQRGFDGRQDLSDLVVQIFLRNPGDIVHHLFGLAGADAQQYHAGVQTGQQAAGMHGGTEILPGAQFFQAILCPGGKYGILHQVLHQLQAAFRVETAAQRQSHGACEPAGADLIPQRAEKVEMTEHFVKRAAAFGGMGEGQASRKEQDEQSQEKHGVSVKNGTYVHEPRETRSFPCPAG